MPNPDRFRRRDYERRVRDALRYMDARMGERVALADVAREACFSPHHFLRIFQAFTGETPGEALQRLRLEKGAFLLSRKPREPIAHIALTVGFASQATFSRAFRERFGETPAAWRRRKLDDPNASLFTDDGDSDRNSALGKTSSAPGETKAETGKESGAFAAYVGSVNHNDSQQHERNATMEITIKEFDPIRMAYVAHFGEYEGDGIPKAFDRLAQWAGPRGLINPNANFIGVGLDDPSVTPVEKCRYYAGLTVPENVEGKDDVGVHVIPGGPCAVLRFRGDKAALQEAFRKIYGEWLPESGFEPAEHPAYELYLSEPEGDPANPTFECELRLPVKES
ncbi:MAG: helix-turn-helix domain-containing protein [Ignavibacteriales bacterium]|nr:helix-turn-helix domain-containing protein [Ignavibacteriales bacterium]